MAGGGLRAAELSDVLALGVLRVLRRRVGFRFFGRFAFSQIGAQSFGQALRAFGIILAHFPSIWRDVLDPSIAFVHRRASLRFATREFVYRMV